MFVTTGTINDRIISDIKQFLISRGRKRVLFIVAGVVLTAALINWTAGNTSLAAILLCLSALLVLEHFWIIHNAYKQFMRRVQENNGKREVEYATSFQETGMELKNIGTGGGCTIEYEVFTGLAQTPEVFVLFTKANQLAFVFKGSLDGDQQKAFEPFILEKCKNIRIRKGFLD